MENRQRDRSGNYQLGAGIMMSLTDGRLTDKCRHDWSMATHRHFNSIVKSVSMLKAGKPINLILWFQTVRG